MHTIDSLIRESCLNFSEDPALCYKAGGAWRTMTYGQLWSLSDRIGAGLLRQGFAPGDHAALLAPASPQWVAAYLAVLKVGGVVVPVDKELKSAELRHILADCDARLAFCDVSTIDVLLDVIPGIPDLSQIITLSPLPRETVISDQVAQETEELLGEWKSLVNRCGIPPEHSQRIETLAGRLYGLLSASSGAAGGRDMPDPFAQIESTRKRLLKEKRLLPLDDICHTAPLPEKLNLPDHTAVILYTSGTTGRSKGAMLSHANIVSNIKAATAHFGLDRSISTLSFLPINHVFEQVCGVLLPLSLGGKVTFCESLKKLGENLAEIKPTFFLAVPAVYRMLLDRIMKNIGASSLTQMLFNFPLTRPLITSKIRRTFGSGTILIKYWFSVSDEEQERDAEPERADRGVQRQRHRGGRGVAVLVDGHDQPVFGQAELARSGRQDADVGLVRNQPVDVGIGAAGLLERGAGRLLQHAHGQLEHGLAIHAQQRRSQHLPPRDMAGCAQNAYVRPVCM